MANAIREFFKDYGIRLIPAPLDNMIPGCIFKKKYSRYSMLTSISRLLEDEPKKLFKTEIIDANLLENNLETSMNLEGKASLNKFGVKIGGGLKTAKSVSIKISDVKGEVFTNTDWIDLRPRIMKLKQTNKSAFKMIKGEYLADIMYYAAELTFTFQTEGSSGMAAEVDYSNITVGANTTAEWKKKNQLLVKGNVVVPLGFHGWKIK